MFLRVSKVWAGCDIGDELSVFASSPLASGDVEIYVYSPDDCGYHEFSDRASTLSFVRTTKERGCIDTDTWFRVETISRQCLDNFGNCI